MGILEKIVSIDQFGAFFQLSIQGQNPQYKSLWGAIATLIINTSAIGYFSYLLYIWISDQSVPSVVTEQVFQKEGSTFYLNQQSFSFNIEMFDNETLEQNHGKYFYNVSTKFFMDGKILDFDSYQPNCEKIYRMDLFNPICQNLNDPLQQKLTQNYQYRLYDDYLGYFFNPCNPNEQNCISEQGDAKKFMNNLDGEGRVTLLQQQFNIGDKQLNTIPFDYYFPLNFEQKTTVNLILTPTKLQLIKGVIFQEIQEIEFISKIEVKLINTIREENDSYFVIWVTLDRSELQTKIEFPRLTQILAQFSSILSALMGIGIVFNLINYSILKKKLVNQIGDVYFWNYEKLNQTKLDQTFFKLMNAKKLQKIQHLILSKCNFVDIMFEISRLQMAIQTIFDRDHLKQIQKMKYTIIEDGNLRIDDTQFQAILTEKNFETFAMATVLKEDITLDQIQTYDFGIKMNEVIMANIQNQSIPSHAIILGSNEKMDSAKNGSLQSSKIDLQKRIKFYSLNYQNNLADKDKDNVIVSQQQ